MQQISLDLSCPFSARFLDLIWKGPVAQLLPELRQRCPSCHGKPTDWNNGGCLVLAQGVYGWLRLCWHRQQRRKKPPPCLPWRPHLLAVWESWDEIPYHVGVRLGSCFLDGDGLQPCDTLLAGWQNFFQGGAFLAPLPRWAVEEYRFLVHQEISTKITWVLLNECAVADGLYKGTCSACSSTSPCSFGPLS